MASRWQNPPPNPIKDLIDEAEEAFKAAGFDVPRFQARVIMAHILDIDIGTMASEARREITPHQVRAFRHLVSQRADHMPLNYVLGNVEFMGLTFLCDSRALSPRQETELLAEMMVERVQKDDFHDGIALDIGCGSGVLGLTLAHFAPSLHVIGSDISFDALQLFCENARRLGLTHRVTAVQGRYIDWLWHHHSDRIAYIVSNPPYVRPDEYDELDPEITQYEPKEALISHTDDGLGAYWEIAMRLDIFQKLRIVAFEIGYQQQEVRQIMREARPDMHWELHNDYSGNPRIVIGENRWLID